jgi:predicted permease
MLRNFFKVTIRNMIRYKAYSFLNIFGLTVGIAASVMIRLWVNNELSYDDFHAKSAQLYRLTAEVSGMKLAVNPAALSADLIREIPDVRNVARLYFVSGLVTVEGQKFEEDKVLYADSSFLSMFDFPLREGDARGVLHNPDHVLLTQATARKYFGPRDALGKTIQLDNRHTFTVAGVLKDVPANSHLKFDLLLPMSFLARTDDDLRTNSWANFSFFTYLQLDRNIDSEEEVRRVNHQINAFYKQNFTRFTSTFSLQPLEKIHLYSDYQADLPGHGRLLYIQVFTVVAAFVLLIACVNFMNLASARSARRAKEVGIRKAVGSQRGQLFVQFLGESFLITLLALVLAVAVAWLLLPLFNSAINTHLSLDLLNTNFIVSLLVLVVFTGLLAGSYPAFLLSAMKPVEVLKGTIRAAAGAETARKVLIVFQFTLSIMLLIGTLFVYKQLNYIQSKHLGFDKENLVYFPVNGDMWNKIQALRTELEGNVLTSQYTVASGVPTNYTNSTISIDWDGKDPAQKPNFSVMEADRHFIDVFKLKLVAGRNFGDNFRADSANLIVNEAALAKMGYTAAGAIGRPVTLWNTKGVIIGVVKDFNYQPLRQSVEPLAMRLVQGGGVVIVRTRSGQVEKTLARLESLHKTLNPTYPFSFNFVTQDLDRLYQAEQQIGKILNIFAGIAVLISCLGLFGLAAFTTEQRTKEIGIRKVMGAGVANILVLLYAYFFRLVLIAVVIAIPGAWYAVNKWLANYTFRTEITAGPFILAGILAMLVAVLTVSYQSVKAALFNPVDSLKTNL